MGYIYIYITPCIDYMQNIYIYIYELFYYSLLSKILYVKILMIVLTTQIEVNSCRVIIYLLMCDVSGLDPSSGRTKRI